MIDRAANKSVAVEMQRVSCLFGKFAALRDVSLSVPAGASVVLLGENGAGKSTLLRMVAGLTSATYGSIKVFGNPPSERKTSVAYMSHAPMLYDELTGIENLQYFARLHASDLMEGSGPTLSPHAALREVGLDPELSRRVGEYSQGMRQRTSLARVLMTQPKLLLLDEPFSNLDVVSAQAMIERLQAFVQSPSESGGRRTLILTTHQAELARPLAGITLRMAEGRLVSAS